MADDLILKGDCIVIPSSKQNKILKAIHEGHLGIEKCKARTCIFGFFVKVFGCLHISFSWLDVTRLKFHFLENCWNYLLLNGILSAITVFGILCLAKIPFIALLNCTIDSFKVLLQDTLKNNPPLEDNLDWLV